jgi:hypothetical protein
MHPGTSEIVAFAREGNSTRMLVGNSGGIKPE